MRDEDWKAKLSQTMSGRKHSPETKAKMAENNKGRKQSEETKLKIKYKHLIRNGMDPVEAQKVVDSLKSIVEVLSGSPLQETESTVVVEKDLKQKEATLTQINLIRKVKKLEPFKTYDEMMKYKYETGSFS